MRKVNLDAQWKMKIINPISRDRYMAKLFRIFVKATVILLLLAAASQGQTAQKPIDSDSSDIRVLEERVKNMGEKMADNKAEIKDELDDKFQELNTRMYIYIGFVVAMIAFIGFFLNLFGKKSIRSWVDEKINEIAKEELDVRLEPIYIKYKDEKTKELEERWESRLKEIEEEWTFHKQEMKNIMKKIEDQQTIPTEELEHALKRLGEIKQEKEFSGADWVFKAYNEAQKGNHEKAISYYDEVIKLDPNYAFAYNNRGFCFDELKKYERSIEDYNKAIELSPEYAIAYNNRGVSYYQLDKYEKAIEDYDTAIQLDPKHIATYANIAELRIVLNEYEEALKILDKAIQLPSELDLKAVLIYLKCITVHLLNEETESVEKELDAILAKDFIVISSTDQIEEWLSKADLPPDTKRFIEEKTEMLKKKKRK